MARCSGPSGGRWALPELHGGPRSCRGRLAGTDALTDHGRRPWPTDAHPSPHDYIPQIIFSIVVAAVTGTKLSYGDLCQLNVNPTTGRVCDFVYPTVGFSLAVNLGIIVGTVRQEAGAPAADGLHFVGFSGVGASGRGLGRFTEAGPQHAEQPRHARMPGRRCMSSARRPRVLSRGLGRLARPCMSSFGGWCSPSPFPVSAVGWVGIRKKARPLSSKWGGSMQMTWAGGRDPAARRQWHASNAGSPCPLIGPCDPCRSPRAAGDGCRAAGDGGQERRGGAELDHHRGVPGDRHHFHLGKVRWEGV